MPDSRRQTFERFSTFPLEAKVAVVLFLLVGLGGVVYGFRGIFFQLDKPFFAQLNYSGPQYLSLEEREAQEIERQKKEDTDEDGVNDYDEIYVFKTSPYLVDTDSDGVDDAQEIRLGKDPSCPEGQDCTRIIASLDGVGSGPDLVSSLVGEEPTFDLGIGNLTDTDALKERIGQTAPGELRQMLLGTGVEPLIVERLDDNQIRELFNLAAEDAQQTGLLDDLLDQQTELSERVSENIEEIVSGETGSSEERSEE